MNDRELLEFAAIAAKSVSCDGIEIGKWNPLENDGDALRLAVQLQLTICNEHINAGVAYCTNGDTDYSFVTSGGNSAKVIDDDFAATRLAIVLAAAEIGRAK